MSSRHVRNNQNIGQYADNVTAAYDAFSDIDWKGSIQNNGVKSAEEWKNMKFKDAVGENGAVIDVSRDEYKTDFSKTSTFEVTLGEQINAIFEAVKTMFDLVKTTLDTSKTLMETAAQLEQFVTLNPIVTILDEIIKLINDYMTDMEETGVFVLPLTFGDGKRGADNLRSQVIDAFNYAEQFEGMSGVNVVAGQPLGFKHAGVLLSLDEKAGFETGKEEDYEEYYTNKQKKVIADLRMSSAGPNFTERMTIMGFGLICNFSNPLPSIRKTLKQFLEVWDIKDFMRTKKNLSSIRFNSDRIKDGVRFTWQPMSTATLFTTAKDDGYLSTEDTLLSQDIRSYPHIRISLFKDEISESGDGTEETVKGAQEFYNEDKPFKDIWLCGIKKEKSVPISVYDEAVSVWKDNIDSIYEETPETVEYYSQDRDNQIAALLDAYGGSGVVHGMERADTVTFYVRIYSPLSFFKTDEAEEYISIGPRYVEDFASAFDAPAQISSSMSPWFGKKLAELLPFIKKGFDVVREQMKKLRDKFDTVDDTLSDAIGMVGEAKEDIERVINKISEVLDSIEAFTDIFSDTHASFTSWIMSPVNGSEIDVPGGNTLLRKEILGAIEHMRGNGTIQDGDMNFGVFVFCGYIQEDVSSINQASKAFDNFIQMFGGMGGETDEYLDAAQSPLLFTGTIIEGSDAMVVDHDGEVDVGYRVAGDGLVGGTVVKTIIDGGIEMDQKAIKDRTGVFRFTPPLES